MTERIFHLVPSTDIADFMASRGAGWAPPSLASEGFIHLSFGPQIAGTLDVHFASETEVLVVEVDRQSVAQALKVEISRGSKAFPHVYRAFESEDLLRGWHLHRPTGGAWQVPDFAAAWEADAPQADWLPKR
ncbi:MAG: hypothetical protein ACI8TQ_001586 [Planctomycetota bacterium]|jgi:uncharacterized protein (DUF952 family)